MVKRSGCFFVFFICARPDEQGGIWTGLIRGPNAPGLLRPGVYGGGTGLMRSEENTLPSEEQRLRSGHMQRGMKNRDLVNW